MKLRRLGIAVLVLAAVVGTGTVALPEAASAATYGETTGGVANTWTNPSNAGGYAGPQIGGNQTVQIACKLQGFQVADGNTWWYQIASSPWNYAYYVSADPFYNNGQTSGSLHGTPFVDSAVPDCASGSGISETAGGLANAWTDYSSAGGTAGPQLASNVTVQIACKITGFRVADGNTWWYQIASAPWNNGFYVSADAFYNNGSTSGSLVGTPWVDPAVPDCAGSSGGSGSPTMTLAQGPTAPAGYRYAISLSGFAPNSSVSLNCYDSVSPSGFYPFSLSTDGSGNAFTQSSCYSGDGPDHWVIANGRTESNHITWGAGSSGGGGGTGGGSGSGGGGGTGGGGTSPSVLACIFAMRWPSLNLTVDYKGNHRYYGNAYAAVQEWNNAGAGVHFSIAKGSTSAQISFVDQYSYAPDPGAAAHTNINPNWENPSQADGYAYHGFPPVVMHSPGHIDILVFQSQMDTLKDRYRTYALAHELGHALGLAHSDTCTFDPSIMKQGGPDAAARSIITVQPYDVAELKELYNE